MARLASGKGRVMTETEQHHDEFAARLDLIGVILGDSGLDVIPTFYADEKSRGARGRCRRGPYELTMSYEFSVEDLCRLQLSVAKGRRALKMTYDGQWHCQSARNPNYQIHGLPEASAERLLREMVKLVADTPAA